MRRQTQCDAALASGAEAISGARKRSDQTMFGSLTRGCVNGDLLPPRGRKGKRSGVKDETAGAKIGRHCDRSIRVIKHKETPPPPRIVPIEPCQFLTQPPRKNCRNHWHVNAPKLAHEGQPRVFAPIALRIRLLDLTASGHLRSASCTFRKQVLMQSAHAGSFLCLCATRIF